MSKLIMSKLGSSVAQIIDMSLATFVKLVAFALFVGANYAVLALVSWLLKEEISKYQVVSELFDLVRIGLAILAIIIFFTDGIYSTWEMLNYYRNLPKKTETNSGAIANVSLKEAMNSPNEIYGNGQKGFSPDSSLSPEDIDSTASKENQIV